MCTYVKKEFTLKKETQNFFFHASMKTILEPPLIYGIHNYSSLFSRSDPFFSRLNGGSSLFDDLIDGAQARTTIEMDRTLS